MQRFSMMPGGPTEEDEALAMQEMEAAAAPPATPPTESEVPADDPRLAAALEQQRKLELYSGLLKGFQQIASSKAIGYGYKPDYTGSEILSQAAKHPVEQYKAQLGREDQLKKQKIDQEKLGMEKESHKASQEKHVAQMDSFQTSLSKANLDLENEQKTSDPASKESQFAQDRVLQKQKELGQPLNEASVRGQSAKQLANTFKYLQDDVIQYYKNKNDALDRASKEKISAEGLKSKENIAATKTQAQAQEPSFKEKEEIKAQTKEDVQIKKENRKERSQLQKDYQTWDSLEKQIDDAIAKVQEYSKGMGPGTGIVAKAKSMTGSLAPEAQSLDTALQKLSMDQLVKQFSGMSKAIDTPAERAAFQATVPTIGMDDALLMDELGKRKQAAIDAKTRIQNGMNRYDKTGKFNEESSESDFIMMQAPDGSPPVKIRKEQAQKYLDKGAKIVQPGQ